MVAWCNELACNQKVGGSIHTSCKHFSSTSMYTQLYPQNQEVFITTSFGGDVKPIISITGRPYYCKFILRGHQQKYINFQPYTVLGSQLFDGR